MVVRAGIALCGFKKVFVIFFLQRIQGENCSDSNLAPVREAFWPFVELMTKGVFKTLLDSGSEVFHVSDCGFEVVVFCAGQRMEDPKDLLESVLYSSYVETAFLNGTAVKSDVESREQEQKEAESRDALARVLFGVRIKYFFHDQKLFFFKKRQYQVVVCGL